MASYERESRRPAQLPLTLGHKVALGAEDFLVAPCNRIAAEWIERWPDWPFPALILVGPSGSGKTHLAQLWRARSGAEPVDPAQADVERLAALAGTVRAASVDDADRVAGHPAAEAALLHLYNLMKAAGGHLLITAQHPPAAWGIGLPDLASRLNAAMVASIDPPDDSLLASVVLKLFADRQIEVGEELVRYLLAHGERSFAWMARAVESIDRAALAAKRPATVALARDVVPGLG